MIKQSLKLHLVFFFLIWGILLFAGAFWADHQRPAGDEPHYLIIAQSLIKDHDLDLKNNYAKKDYRAWGYPIETLDQHTSVNSRNGKAYSVHGIGWPLVFSPFLALGGRPGITFLISLIGAALVFNLYLLIKYYTKKDFISIFVAAIIGLSAPILIYSTQIFNEIFGALLTLYAFRKIVEKSENTWDHCLAILTIAYLPWVHIKYLFLSLVLIFWYAKTYWQKQAMFGGLIYLLNLSALGYFLFRYYGSFSPNAQYPSGFGFDLARLGQGILALFFDRTFGFLPLAPVYFFSLAGFYFLYQKNKGIFWQTLTVFSGLFLVQAAGATAIGWAPPGRFLVVVLPLLALPLSACYLRLHAWSKIFFWFLTGWGIFISYFLVRHPDLNYSLSEPKYLNALGNLGRYFPPLLSVEHYLPLNHSTILTAAFWLFLILGLNLVIVLKPKKLKT